MRQVSESRNTAQPSLFCCVATAVVVPCGVLDTFRAELCNGVRIGESVSLCVELHTNQHDARWQQKYTERRTPCGLMNRCGVYKLLHLHRMSEYLRLLNYRSPTSPFSTQKSFWTDAMRDFKAASSLPCLSTCQKMNFLLPILTLSSSHLWLQIRMARSSIYFTTQRRNLPSTYLTTGPEAHSSQHITSASIFTSA